VKPGSRRASAHRGSEPMAGTEHRGARFAEEDNLHAIFEEMQTNRSVIAIGNDAVGVGAWARAAAVGLRLGTAGPHDSERGDSRRSTAEVNCEDTRRYTDSGHSEEVVARAIEGAPIAGSVTK